MIELVVDAVSVSISGLPEDKDTWPTAGLLEILTFAPRGARFSPKFSRRKQDGSRVWDGKIRMIRSGRFPTGLLARVVDFLVRYDIEHHVVDERGDPVLNLLDPSQVNPKFEAFAFQGIAADRILEHRRGVVWAPPRVGKTAIAAEVYRRTQMPMLFVVPSVSLLHQSAEQLKWFLPGVEVGRIGDGICEHDADIVVATSHTLAAAFGIHVKKSRGNSDGRRRKREVAIPREHHPAVRDACLRSRAVFWDECHHSQTPSNVRLSRKLIRARIVVGLSASPWAPRGNDLVIEGVTGPVVFSMTVSEAIALGRLVPIHATVVRLPPRDLIAKRDEYDDLYDAHVVRDEWFHDQVASLAMHLRSRGHSVLVIVQRIEHGASLSQRIKEGCFWVHGNTSGAKRKKIFAEMSEGTDKILVSNVVNEGVDIPGLTATIVADPKGSSILSTQRPARGATAHAGKSAATVVLFDHGVPYLSKHTRAAIAALRNEPAYTVVRREIDVHGNLSKPKRLRPLLIAPERCRLFRLDGRAASGEPGASGTVGGEGATDPRDGIGDRKSAAQPGGSGANRGWTERLGETLPLALS